MGVLALRYISIAGSSWPALTGEISDDCHGWALDGEFRDRNLDDAGG
jgi:hypothetical protein